MSEPAGAPRFVRGAPASPVVLECQELSFRYRRSRPFVMRGVNWTVDAGEKIALLGPNGAGKSTLMKVIAGVLEPAEGVIRVDGIATDGHARARSIARMPQQASAIPRLTSREQVTYAGWLGGLPERVASERAGESLRAVGLLEEENTSASALSGGQLRRLALAEALVRQTPVLMLDEPTAGLDPDQRRRFRGVLGSLPAAMVVSTHETHDIADLFDRITVLVGGRILFDGPAEDLLVRTKANTVEGAYSRLVGGVDL